MILYFINLMLFLQDENYKILGGIKIVMDI